VEAIEKCLREAVSADPRRDKIEELFRTHSRGVGGYVLARVGDAELAEAITSRVFLIVVRAIEQCKGSPTAWLWSIVRSELARHFRDRKKHVALDESLPDPAAEPFEQVSAREMQAKMRQALERLPDEQQQLVYMRFFQGLANKEIAEATGLTASNVGVSIHRALKQLRMYIEPANQTVEGRI
jgi:RNA polymerase sigma-70 factor (ECF subfamily)